MNFIDSESWTIHFEGQFKPMLIWTYKARVQEEQLASDHCSIRDD